jgi:photosystem II stability/assembly factor-like uncharacterized protein
MVLNQIKAIVLLLLFVVLTTEAKAQRYKRSFKFVPLGPFETPLGTEDTGSMTPNGLGWVETLFVAPSNPMIIYAGSNSGGLYKTENGGDSWHFVSDWFPVTGVLDLVIDRYNPDVIWAATGTTVNQYGYGHGVLKSSDGGKHWFYTGLAFLPENEKVIWALGRDNYLPNRFVAVENNQIYLSTDEGRNYEKSYDGKSDIKDFRQVILGKEFDLVSGNRLFKSTDKGRSWTDVSEGLSFAAGSALSTSWPDRIAIAVNPSDSNAILALYRFGNKNFIDHSANGGDTWSNIYAGRDFSRVDRNHAEIAYDPLDTNIIYVGSVRMYRSDNHGKDFKLISMPIVGASNQMHDDIRAIHTNIEGKIYVGNDGGVSMSSDKGETWENLNGKGLTITQVYGIASSPLKEQHLLIGCQDLSSFHFDGNRWINIESIYGDGGQCLYGDSLMLIMQNGRLNESSGDLSKWNSLHTPYRANRLDYPLQFFYENEQAILATDDHIWLKEPKERWKSISQDLGVHSTKIVAMDHLKTGEESVFYIAKDQPTWGDGEALTGRFFKGIIRGDSGSWVDITNKLPILAWRHITDIQIDPDDVEHVWVCLYGYDDHHGRFKVFESKDGGESWQNVSNGLMNFNTFDLIYVPNSSNGLFLCTEGGLYFRNDYLNDWVKIKGDMPNLMLKHAAIQIDHKKLYLGTYGGGVWELKLNRYLRR